MTKEYHFIKEIREQPEVIQKSLDTAKSFVKEIAQKYVGKVDRIIMTGCGDPYMLGIGAVYAFENWAKIPAESIEAAELSMSRRELLNEKTLVILISSSGKTIKVINSARLAVESNAPHFGLTNLVPSSLTEVSTTYIQTQAGWSDSFPTKQTTTAYAVLIALALEWAELAGTMPEEEISRLRKSLFEDLPKAAATCLKLDTKMKSIAQECLDAPIYTFVGSGPNLCTAMLAAAKMKETSQSRSEACNLEEYAHLHILSLKPEDPVFFIPYAGVYGKAYREITKKVLGHGGRLYVVVPEEEAAKWQEMDAKVFVVPDHPEMFGPILSWIPLQLFAYHISIGKRRNPDKPIDYQQFEIGYDIYTSPLEGWEDR
jgi:glucosamine--fructose-6-phosphate aminotransferase (isomerizing)